MGAMVHTARRFRKWRTGMSDRGVRLALGLVLLTAGCGLRVWQIDMVANAYEVRPERGQDPAQPRADVEACKRRLLAQRGQLEPSSGIGATVPAGYGVAIEAERNLRFT